MQQFSASSLIDVLISGTGAEKIKGMDWLEGCKEVNELDRLRALLTHHLTHSHKPRANPKEESRQRLDARGWMLAALGRVSREQPEAQQLLSQHLNPTYEPNRWGRYWALEGIVTAGGDDVKRFATQAAKDPDPLLECLGLAILAEKGDEGSLKAFRKRLPHDLWAGLRALRISMLLDPQVLDKVLSIVRKGDYSDATYDAIIALGRVPPGTQEAEEAAEVLSGYVRTNRWPMYDSMRTNALVSLAKLKSILPVPVLMEELTDENPMIVLQAARALEAALGSRVASRRILEAASRGPRPPQAYAGSLRALDRASVIDELETALATGTTDESDSALTLLRELGGAEALDRLSAMRRTTEAYVTAQSQADAELRQDVAQALAEARQGFRIVTGMDVAVFIAGYALLGLGVYLVLTGSEPQDRLVGAVTSSAGFAGVILKNWLIKARDQIEPSVRRLASLQASFHGYLRQLRQVDQAYTQRLLQGQIEPEEVRDYTGIVESATQRAVEQFSAPATPDQRSP